MFKFFNQTFLAEKLELYFGVLYRVGRKEWAPLISLFNKMFFFNILALFEKNVIIETQNKPFFDHLKVDTA